MNKTSKKLEQSNLQQEKGQNHGYEQKQGQEQQKKEEQKQRQGQEEQPGKEEQQVKEEHQEDEQQQQEQKRPNQVKQERSEEILHKAGMIEQYIEYKMNEVALESAIYAFRLRKSSLWTIEEAYKKRMFLRRALDVRYQQLTADYELLKKHRIQAEDEHILIKENNVHLNKLNQLFKGKPKNRALEELIIHLDQLGSRYNTHSVPKNYLTLLDLSPQDVLDKVARTSFDEFKNLEKNVDYTYMSEIESSPIDTSYVRNYGETHFEESVRGLNILDYKYEN